MPVLMIATYNDDGSVDVMNMAWGGICAENMVALNLDETHQTSANIKSRKAFTVSIADVDHIAESDFFGIASAKTMPDKFERSGMHAVKSTRVDAPIVEEYPLTLECTVKHIEHGVCGFRVVGEIVNVIVDEGILNAQGKIDPSKLNTFVFDQFQNGYYRIGEQCGKAWHAGAALMKK